MDSNLVIRIEKSLTDLINYLRNRVSNNDIEELEEYRDVGEYGLCLETIAGVIYENNVPISRLIYGLICETGKLMEINERNWIWIEELVEEKR